VADFTPSRIGQVNEAGDAKAIFLEVFSGMVLEAFDTNQVTDTRVTKRNIKSGKSAQFPLIWKANALYHTAGEELDGQKISHAKKTISIEELLVADVFVDVLDEAMNHYEVRAEYSHQLGEALGNAYDSNNFRCIWAGGAASHPITEAQAAPDSNGEVISAANMTTSATAIKAAIYDGAMTLDQKNVPDSDRYCALPPLGWYLLLEDGEFIHRDYAGEGSQARAKMPFAADLQILKTNNIPTTDESTSVPEDVPSALQLDFTGYAGAIWHKGAVGVVKLLDLKTEEEYSVRHQGSLLVAKYAIGQSYLRTECSVVLDDSSL
jgi:hypothetical protein